ncbi:MAG: hypothetical protein AB1330_01595 [Bacillota bacterium]
MLAGDRSLRVRQAAVNSPFLTARALEMFLHDRSWLVRRKVFSIRPDLFQGRELEGMTPGELINVKASDEEVRAFYYKVDACDRMYLVCNPHCPLDLVCDFLRRTRSLGAVEAVLDSHHELGPEMVRLAYRKALGTYRRYGWTSYAYIIVHPNCPEDVLFAVSLIGDRYESIRAAEILARRFRSKVY